MTSRQKNIWQYANHYTPFIEEEFRLTLGEGGTRTLELDALNDELSKGRARRFIFKREDENPTGSHKARALAYQVSYYRSKGLKALIISSSGNAAISAAAYSNLCGIRLIAFIDKSTPKAKVDMIKRSGQTVLFCAKPINFAKYASKIFKIPNLRPSMDDLSIQPYQSIAFELYDELADAVDAVFMFPTSASSLVGTIKGYLALSQEKGGDFTPPKVIAVQTGSITSIADCFIDDKDKRGAGESGDVTLAGALAVKRTRRTEEAVSLINKVGGSGIIVTSEEIQSAYSMLNRYSVITSMEGVAAFAGAIKMDGIKNAVCILSGRAYNECGEEIPGEEYHVESYSDVKELLGNLLRRKY